jgi:hypothetical protein
MDKFSVANIAGVTPEEVVGTIGEYKSSQKTIKTTIENIIKVNNERKKSKIKLYRMMLRECINKIERQNLLRKIDTTFKFDDIIYGHPEYIRDECIEYVINELNTYHFETYRIDNKTIFISWKFMDSN